MSNKLIPKAFLITKENINNIHLPQIFDLSQNYKLYVSSDLKVKTYTSEKGSAYLLGYAFDNSAPNLSEIEILENVTDEDLNASAHNINHLNGSFVIIKDTIKGLELFSDAAGFRSPYYTEDLTIVSSHDKLIGDIFGKRKIYSSTKTLDYSRYEGVFKLVPSNKIIVSKMKERIFPNPELEHMKYNEILAELKKQINNLNISLENIQNKLLVSITGGIDSKCTLAMSKPIKKSVKTFTYIKEIEAITNVRAKNIYKTDKLIVERLVNNLNLDHELIEFKVDQADEDFSKNMYEVTGTVFNHPVAEIFEEKYKNEQFDILQFRSVIYSNAKFDYPKAFYYNKLSIVDFYDYLQNKQLKIKSTEDAKSIIDNYLARTKTDVFEENIIKTLDVIHLDARMGNWHSQLVKETDRVMDYFNYINDRSSLNLLLQLPHEVRKYHILHKDLINTYWPILNFFEGNVNNNLFRLERENIMSSIASDKGIDEFVHIKFDYDFEEHSLALIPKVNLKDTGLIRYHFSVISDDTKNLFSKYAKDNGRNYISVIISKEGQKDVLDIVDLSNGYQLLANERYDIEIKYHKPTTTNSWVKAGTLYL
ncbi:hypothetical protein ETI06_02190 [Macrococcoides goetzii]|nr:hypothetical protein [Macrococcus goetzii]TDM50808.1 hypothetical protein ETI06_02190 [Macrococcus goetzii]